MARLEGVDIPDHKRAEVSLTYIYGIGFTRARSLLYRAGIPFDKKMGDLDDQETTALRTLLEEEGAVEGDRPTDKQQGNENAVGALDSEGLPKDRLAIAEDVIGANADQTQG